MNSTSIRSLALSFVLGAAALTGCNVDFVPPVETDAAPAADAGTPAVDNGPQGPVCGDGVCSGDRDCAADCRQAPPADAGTPPPPVCGGANLQTDVANCGTCGNRCAAGQTCNAGTCTNAPVADAGTPVPTVDDWRLIYRAPSGATVTAIQSIEVWDGSARECTLNVRDPEQRGAALTGTDRCPTMRFNRGATLRFNGRFTLAATSSSAPMPLENWSCHIDRVGGPMLPFGTVEAYRNGERVQLRMVDNERGGCNWAPVSN